MDIQEYISSGVIEAYVLGIASEDEIRELESISSQYPEIATAIVSYQETMEEYADLHAIPPPEGLKNQIWSNLVQEEEQQGNVVAFDSDKNGTESNQSFQNNSNTVPFRKPSYAGVAAAIVLLIGSLLVNFVMWNKSNVASQEVASLQKEHIVSLALQAGMQQELAENNKNLKLLMDPAVKPVQLAGVGTHTTNKALLVWNTNSKEVYLSLENMPPPPHGKQYQLWAIVDGKPVDAGVFNSNTKNLLQKMKVIPDAQMFAITLENEGGSAVPTMDQMFVAGKV